MPDELSKYAKHLSVSHPDANPSRNPSRNPMLTRAVTPCQMSVVDTPGTNVILERQQRLTEEFVPRADLVLFVLSADRALTESEVRTAN